jgi:subtilisin family serine protease
LSPSSTPAWWPTQTCERREIRLQYRRRQKAAGGDLRFDAYGHGSHIASLIGNIGAADDAPYRGVAAGASVLALKVLDANGAGYTSNVIAAIEFCIANKYALKIDIINLSLGHPIYEPAETDPLVQAVERGGARRHGRDRRGWQPRCQ